MGNNFEEIQTPFQFATAALFRDLIDLREKYKQIREANRMDDLLEETTESEEMDFLINKHPLSIYQDVRAWTAFAYKDTTQEWSNKLHESQLSFLLVWPEFFLHRARNRNT